MHIKRNDNVLVLAGKDAGKQGKVLKVFHNDDRALVEKVNFVKRHTRPNPNRGIQGGVAERESPVHVSNLMVVCPDCSKPTRVKNETLEDGTKSRVCRKCGATL